jgi:hypothetical protein
MSDTADNPNPDGTTADTDTGDVVESVKELIEEERERVVGSDDDSESTDASVEGDADESA